MAHGGIGYFDGRGHFFKTPEEATQSDLAIMLGKVGDGESLAPGIANMLLERRHDLERIFAEHDALKIEQTKARELAVASASNVTPLPGKLVRKAN